MILLTQKSLQSRTSTLTSQALVTHLMRDCPLKHCSPFADAPQVLSATSVPPRSPSAVHPSSLRTNIGKIPWMPADFGTVWWVWNVWNCRGLARRLIKDILNVFKDYESTFSGEWHYDNREFCVCSFGKSVCTLWVLPSKDSVGGCCLVGHILDCKQVSGATGAPLRKTSNNSKIIGYVPVQIHSIPQHLGRGGCTKDINVLPMEFHGKVLIVLQQVPQPSATCTRVRGTLPYIHRCLKLCTWRLQTSQHTDLSFSLGPRRKDCTAKEGTKHD